MKALLFYFYHKYSDVDKRKDFFTTEEFNLLLDANFGLKIKCLDL